MTALAIIALICSVIAIAMAAATARTAGRSRGPAAQESDLPTDVLGLRQEVAALRLDLADSLRHVALIRYDAFTDSGGKLSWSLAVLDEHGSGVLITSIHGRNDARTYAKSISDWRCEQALSPEEQDAVDSARP